MGSLGLSLASQEELRDFQTEVEEQGREPYQNVDVLVDRLTAEGRALPPYDELPDYVDSP